jgi:hypothetical protein
MHWVAPTEKDAPTETLEKRLWDSAGQFRANFGLKAQEYSGPNSHPTHAHRRRKSSKTSWKFAL